MPVDIYTFHLKKIAPRLCFPQSGKSHRHRDQSSKRKKWAGGRMEWTHKENIKEVKSIRRFTLVHMIIGGGVQAMNFLAL